MDQKWLLVQNPTSCMKMLKLFSFSSIIAQIHFHPIKSHSFFQFLLRTEALRITLPVSHKNTSEFLILYLSFSPEVTYTNKTKINFEALSTCSYCTSYMKIIYLLSGVTIAIYHKILVRQHQKRFNSLYFLLQMDSTSSNVPTTILWERCSVLTKHNNLTLKNVFNWIIMHDNNTYITMLIAVSGSARLTHNLQHSYYLCTTLDFSPENIFSFWSFISIN